MNIVLTELYKDYWQGAGCAEECKMSDWLNRCHFGDCLTVLRDMPDGIAQTCVTSPPYFGLRSYGHAGQIGLEPTPEEFVAKLVTVFREVRRVLRDDGTLWVNIGDSYCSTAPGTRNAPQTKGSVATPEAWANARPKTPDGMKPKDLMGIPWMLAFALRADGWYLRQEIIWHKPNPMPESVTDRCTKAHEYIFLLSKSAKYYFDADSIAEESVAPVRAREKNNGESAVDTKMRGHDAYCGNSGTRNKRSVWTVSTKPYKGAHFATFPTELIEPCILAGAPAGGIVLDPFFGSGTTGQVAQALGRQFIGIELNDAYKPLQDERLRQPSLILEAA
jgi:DNA modification methylase